MSELANVGKKKNPYQALQTGWNKGLGMICNRYLTHVRYHRQVKHGEDIFAIVGPRRRSQKEKQDREECQLNSSLMGFQDKTTAGFQH